MDNSNDYCDEKEQDENKLSDVNPTSSKSPFRSGPKRLFGNSIANSADENLEETCIEIDSPNLSQTDTEEIDQSLEQPKMEVSFMNTTHNLSVVEEREETSEDDETDGYNTQDDNVFIQDMQLHSPTVQLSETIPMIDDSTPTAPTILGSKIDKGIATFATRSIESLLSPIGIPESQIDCSLHEFEMVEMKVEYEEKIKMFRNEIEKGKAREEILKQFIENLRIKQEGSDHEKQEMEAIISEHHKKIEKLSEQMKRDAAIYRDREQELEKIKEENDLQLKITDEEMKNLQRKVDEIQSIVWETQEEISQLRQESIDTYELKSGHEVVCKTLMEDIGRLESQLSNIQQEQVKNSNEEEVLNVAFQEKATAELTEANKTIAELSKELSELREEATNKYRVFEVEQKESQTETQDMMSQEMASLNSAECVSIELESFRVKVDELSVVVQELQEELSDVKQSCEEKESLKSALRASEREVHDLTSSLDYLRAQSEILRQQFGVSENKVLALQTELQEVCDEAILEEQINNQYKTKLGETEMLVQDLKSAAETSKLEEQNLQTELKQKSEMNNVMLLEIESSMTTIQELKSSEESLRAQLKTVSAQVEELSYSKIAMKTQVIELESDLKSLQREVQIQEELKDKANAELEITRRNFDQLESNVQKLHDLNESNVSEFSVESKQRDSELAILQSNLVELSSQLENAQANLESSNMTLVVLQGQLDDAVSKCVRREKELISQAQQHQKQLEQLQFIITGNGTQNPTERSEIEELHARIEEMQASINFAQNAIETANHAQAALNNDLQESQEKLVAAEEALTVKENTIITLESRVETISRDFEGKLEEANQWKSQAMKFETMTASFSDMQQQTKELTEMLEQSKRRVVEVEKTAQHNIILIQDEKKEQSIALDEAKTRIVALEKQLKRSEKEVNRLGKLCDDFDDEEQDYREEIMKLKAEIKQLKGVEPPPKSMGLLEKARLGVKPQVSDDVFEDAQDSFQSEVDNQSVLPKTDDADEMVHPDDKTLEKRDTEISSNQNQSNCQQQ